MGSRLTEEQAAFAAAVRDFAKRECGTREQRDALTGGGREAHKGGPTRRPPWYETLWRSVEAADRPR